MHRTPVKQGAPPRPTASEGDKEETPRRPKVSPWRQAVKDKWLQRCQTQRQQERQAIRDAFRKPAPAETQLTFQQWLLQEMGGQALPPDEDMTSLAQFEQEVHQEAAEEQALYDAQSAEAFLADEEDAVAAFFAYQANTCPLCTKDQVQDAEGTLHCPTCQWRTSLSVEKRQTKERVMDDLRDQMKRHQQEHTTWCQMSPTLIVSHGNHCLYCEHCHYIGDISLLE